ncbi:MAG: hypothetical protein EPO65_11945, partial [Dehalococcoidia bacterium]
MRNGLASGLVGFAPQTIEASGSAKHGSLIEFPAMHRYVSSRHESAIERAKHVPSCIVLASGFAGTNRTTSVLPPAVEVGRVAVVVTAAVDGEAVDAEDDVGLAVAA